MKKIIIMILVFLTLLLPACQSTPESPVVVGKNIDNLAELAVQKEVSITPTVKVNVPEKLQMELTGHQDKLKIHVDADIVVPNVSSYPTVRVGKGQFTEDDEKKIYQLLMRDVEVISNDSKWTTGSALKAVEGLREQKKTGKLDDMKYESMEDLDAAIEEVLQEAKTLSDTYTRAEPSFEFKPLGDMNIDEIMIRGTKDDISVSDLTIWNSTGEGDSELTYYRSLDNRFSSVLNSGVFDNFSTHVSSPYYVPPKINEQAAEKIATDAIADLGLDDFVCSGKAEGASDDNWFAADDAPQYGLYQFMFTRQVNSVPVTYTNDTGNMIESDATNNFDSPWMYERIRIFVDDDGIACLAWYSPYTITEIVTDNTSLLPFSDIQKIFEKMIPMVDDVYTYGQEKACDMYVTQVKLGLMRVKERNNGSSGLLIPVWDFIGYAERVDDTIGGEYYSLLTVNAIDGSIISREFGY